MKNERVLTLSFFIPLPEIFVKNKRRKHGQERKPATNSNSQRGIVQSEKKRRTVIERDDGD